MVVAFANILMVKVETEILREGPPENHAILKYESTTTISDFAYILCGVIY